MDIWPDVVGGTPHIQLMDIWPDVVGGTPHISNPASRRVGGWVAGWLGGPDAFYSPLWL